MPESTREQQRQSVRVEDRRPEDDALIVTVEGEADLQVAPELRERLASAVQEGATLVVVDLSETTIVDSVTLGALMAAMKRLRARGGQLRLVVGRREVRRTFEIALVDRIFPLYGSREEALAAAANGRERARPELAEGAVGVSPSTRRGTRYAVTPERISSKHGPRLDDRLEHETKGLVDSGSGTRAREDLEPEAPHADEGTAARSTEDDPVLARRELSRHLRMTVFPAGRDALVAEAEQNQAPEWVRHLLASLPDGRQYGTVYEVWDAAGGELEPGVQELLEERERGEAHRP